MKGEVDLNKSSIDNPEILKKYKILEKKFMASQQKIGNLLMMVQNLAIAEKDKAAIERVLYEN